MKFFQALFFIRAHQVPESPGNSFIPELTGAPPCHF